MSVTDYAQLEPEYLRLRAYLTAAQAWVATSTAFLTAAQRNGATSVLNSAAGWIGRLGPTGDLGLGVINGTFETSRWVAIANAQGAQIQNAWEAASPSNTFSDFWTVVVVPTAQQTADVAQKAAEQTTPVLNRLIVLAVLYVVIKVMR